MPKACRFLLPKKNQQKKPSQLGKAFCLLNEIVWESLPVIVLYREKQRYDPVSRCVIA
jgi:hypothetical protein